MGTLTALTLLVVGFILHNKRGTWISPDVYFCYEWAIISFLASLSLFGFYKESDFTWCIILLGCLFFIGGVYIALLNNNGEKVSNVVSIGKPFVNIPTFWLLMIIIAYLTYKDFSYALSFQNAGYTLQQIRHASFGGENIAGYERGSGALYRTFAIIYPPLKLIVYSSGVVYYVSGTKHKLCYLSSVLIVAILDSFTDGGRLNLVLLIIVLLVCQNLYVNRSKTKKMKWWKKYKIYIYVGILISVISAVSTERGWESDVIVEKYYRYICGNIPLLDYYITRMRTNDTIYFIWNSLHGLWGVVFIVLHSLFGIDKPDIYQQALNEVLVTQEMRQIGVDSFMNAYTTPFYHLYADGRIPGVIIGMFLLGLYSGKIYSNAIKRLTGRNVVHYLIITQMLFQTLITFPFAYTSYAMVAVFFLLYKKETFNIIGDWMKVKLWKFR